MSRILVAEDDPHILRIICLWLGRQNHEVLEARNGLIARGILEQQPVDLLVSDLQMPGLDGIGLINFAAGANRVRCGIVILTNRWDHAEVGDQLAALNVQVIPKPFSPSRLAELVEQLLSAGATANAAASAIDPDQKG